MEDATFSFQEMIERYLKALLEIFVYYAVGNQDFKLRLQLNMADAGVAIRGH